MQTCELFDAENPKTRTRLYNKYRTAPQAAQTPKTSAHRLSAKLPHPNFFSL